MIAIIDYGVGNLFSLYSSLKALGEEAVITSDKKEVLGASHVILPGVGAFADAADKLTLLGLDKTVKEVAQKGTPLLGICLGMQLLFDESHEYGVHEGLGLVPGKVVSMERYIDENLKVPHIGWNSLKFEKESPLLKYIKDGDYVYFVHSYFADKCEESVIAYTEYDKYLTAAVQNGNVYGCQFHPEKSGETGLKILKAFCSL